MSKPVAYCSITGRGFSKWEVQKFKAKNGKVCCSCHDEPLVQEYPFKIASVHPVEKIHEMIAEHNSDVEKRFYYSEEEVKRLCRHACNISSDVFEDWWFNVKKK